MRHKLVMLAVMRFTGTAAAHRCLSTVAVIAVLAAPSAVARHQKTTSDTRPAFEAATIKLAPPVKRSRA